MKCHILDFETADWEALDQFPDRAVFQTREWLRFIGETQKTTPVLVGLREDGQLHFAYISRETQRYPALEQNDFRPSSCPSKAPG